MGDPTAVQIFKTIIGVLGILGNGLVCVVIAKVPAMRTLTNAFIFNQALVDFIGSLFVAIHSIVEAPTPLDDNLIIANLQCYILKSNIILWILFVTSTFNLVLLTAERYIAIVFPFRYLTLFGRKQATCMLVGVWVLAVGYKFHVVAFRRVEDGRCIFVDRPKASSITNGVFSFLIEYLIPLIFMTFCYIHIILQLKKASSNVGPEPATSQQGDNTMSGSLLRARRNTLKTLFIVFVSYTICWSLNQITFFAYNFGVKIDLRGSFYYTTIVLVQLNTCINPIIYAFKYKQFQNGLRVLFKPCLPRGAVNTGEHAVRKISANRNVTVSTQVTHKP